MLQLVNVEKNYGHPSHQVPVLRNINLTVETGVFAAVVGPSGSGKSTLMNIIGLLDRPCSGRVALNGQFVDFDAIDAVASIRNRLLGFVFQSSQLLPHLSAWQNAALPLLYRGLKRSERKPLALAALEEVGLRHRADHRPDSLSGGERQRVALARAIIGRPALILADEPTGSLDSTAAAEIMKLLRDRNKRFGTTILMVTHDRDLASQCDRRIAFFDGRLTFDTSAP